jgi:hypothetical protein
VLPGRRVQVESWFDLTGTSPRGAPVKVLRADGSTLAEGKLDSQGVFVFPYGEPEALRVIVNAGAGHRKELDIPARELARSEAPTTTEKGPGTPASPAAEPGEPKPFADRTSRVSVKDVLIGVGFLLAVAAFALGLRNARQLRELKQTHSKTRAPSQGERGD